MRNKFIPILVLILACFGLFTCKTQGDKKSVSYGGGWEKGISESVLQTKIADADKPNIIQTEVEADSASMQKKTANDKLKKPVLHSKDKENFWHSENTKVKSKNGPGPGDGKPNEELEVEKTSRVAIILTIIFAITVIGWILSPISLILAIIGKRIQANNPGVYKNPKEAFIALALSILMMAMVIFIFILQSAGLCGR